MSLISVSFLFFCIILILLYFIVPKKIQWTILLLFSGIFYAMAGIKNVIYILITALSAWASALLIEKIDKGTKKYIKNNLGHINLEEKKLINKKSKAKRRTILVLALLLNIGILCVFKYANFALDQINAVLGSFGSGFSFNYLSLIVPLGISFYTFQTLGYLIDVYWSKNEACKNPLKLLLFTSFFPQITQGPISNYSQLSSQLFSPHSFEYCNLVNGIQRMVWGFFKKIAIADLLAPYVEATFMNYGQYSGLTVLIGIFFYSIQIYADFSGYMDIVCGLCRTMGIKLTENFERPYFSKSIAEYWRRWHMSLGNWFKTYLYYPIAVSKWNTSLGRKVSQKFGRSAGRNLPASIALVAVWLTTGLWHGANWGYVVWGGLNGFFIIFSMWMEPCYELLKNKLKIKGRIWEYTRIVRTFILVTFIKVLPEVGGLGAGLGLWKRIFTNYSIPSSLHALLPFASKIPMIIIIFGTCLMLLVSIAQEKISVYNYFNKLPNIARLFCLSLLVALTIFARFCMGGSGSGFMYAQF